MACTTKIALGTRFLHPIADANPRWEVRKSLRGNCYQVVVVDDEDFGGQTMILHASVIQDHLRAEAFTREVMKASTDFYASLTLGEIVHYHNGFGEFVRSEVVVHEGANHLKPLALVGPWKDYNLHANSYHVRQIREGAIFHPHASNIFENPKASVPRTVNPADLPVLTLEA